MDGERAMENTLFQNLEKEFNELIEIGFVIQISKAYTLDF